MVPKRMLIPGAVFALLMVEASAQQAPPLAPTQAPTFRTGTLVVPLDVRVTDRKGVPITDLTAADFMVTEDRVRQRITQFVPQSEAAGTPTPLTVGARFIDPGVPTPQRRIFLIVLGRGRLQAPGKGVDGAIHLVRNRLLPQDHVAVLAWDRATAFTTDHARVLQVLERFKGEHNAIEAIIAQAAGGLAGVYGSRDYPVSVRSSIDRVFAETGATATPDTVVPNATGIAARERRAVNNLLSEAAGADRGLVPDDVSQLGEFDKYVATTVQSMQDLFSIYRGIDYLKYLDGEKHLLYISPGGVSLPSADDDRSLAATASDARVAIDIIHTGGTSGMADWSFAGSTSSRVAELTGGFYASLMHADKAADRLDAMTRSSYLIGYSPTNRQWDSKYRRVEVRVNRPGAQVHYRHGYFGRESRPPMDAAAVLSLTRISAAVRSATPVTDIQLLRVTASPITGAERSREVLIEFSVSGAKLAFGTDAARRTVKFDLAVFIGDEQQLLVGQTWQTIDLKLEPERYERFLRDGIPISLRVPIRRSSKNAKIVVYDYGSDLMGSAFVSVKKK